MTNFDKYKEEILAEIEDGKTIEDAIYKYSRLYSDKELSGFRADMFRWLTEEYYQPTSQQLYDIKLNY
jgi:hypothetical protein